MEAYWRKAHNGSLRALRCFHIPIICISGSLPKAMEPAIDNLLRFNGVQKISIQGKGFTIVSC